MSLVNVFAVDVTSGGYPSGTTYVPTTPGNTTVRIDSSAWTPTDIAYEILAHLLPGQRIGKLHLASHGNTGELYMGAGINRGNVGGLSLLAPRMSAATPFGPTVLIHGCAVASAVAVEDGCTDNSNPTRPVRRNVCIPTLGQAAGPPTGWAIAGGDLPLRIRRSAGYQFLAAMASALRVTVRGAIHAQDVDRVGQNGWRLEGATLTVRANGQGTLNDPYGNVGVASQAGAYEF